MGSYITALHPIKPVPMTKHEMHNQLTEFDPSSTPEVFYAAKSETKTVASFFAAIDQSPMYPLASIERKNLKQSGVYLLYYLNPDHEVLGRIASTLQPIYTGCARSNAALFGIEDPQYRLYDRLQSHKNSVLKSKGLALEDFGYKFVPTSELITYQLEQTAITVAKGLLNQGSTGFGNTNREARNSELFDLWFARAWDGELPEEKLAESEAALLVLEEKLQAAVMVKEEVEAAGSLSAHFHAYRRKAKRQRRKTDTARLRAGKKPTHKKKKSRPLSTTMDALSA